MYSRKPYSTRPYSAVSQPAATSPAAVTPVFSEYARPITSGLTAAVIATTIIGFVAPPPAQAAVQPTPVFSAFEQPAPVRTTAHQQQSVTFTIAPPAAAFAVFTDFGAPQTTRAPQHEQSVRFEIGFLGPAKTPDRLATFFDFGAPSKIKAAQDGFTNAPRPAAVQNYVFAPFEQPQAKRAALFDQSVQFTPQPLTVAATAQAYVFSQFSQPPPVTRAAHQHPQPAFEVTRVILAVTPGPGIFPRFDQPAFSRTYPAHQQQPSVAFTIAPQQAAVVAVNFSGFAEFGVPRGKPVPQGFTNSPIPPFAQPYVFAPFNQPSLTKAVQEGQISFEIGFLGPAQTPDRLIFSEFARPKFVGVARDGFTNAPAASVVQNYVFSAFEQPQFKRAVPIDALVQFANPPVVIAAVQPYVFGSFEQPQVRKAQFGGWVQFAPQPTVIVAAVSFTGFSEFGTPQRIPQQNGPSVQFEILPPVFVPSVYTFTGFTDFTVPQQQKVIPQDGSAIRFAIAPLPSPIPPTADQWSGKPRGSVHSGKSRSWKPLKKKPLIDELEELIAELNKLARLSPKQVVKAHTPVILARYPQPLADALFELKQNQTAKDIKASVSRAQAEAEYQLVLQQQDDDEVAALLLLQ